MSWYSLRYGKNETNLRDKILQISCFLQRKKCVLLKDNPTLCKKILESSNNKGSFVESLVACPAWKPIYSVESVNGNLWKSLNQEFQNSFKQIKWQRNLPSIVSKELFLLRKRNKKYEDFIDGEGISRWTAGIFSNLVFGGEVLSQDQDLFYRASLEWRKEIAFKEKGSKKIKHDFYKRLGELLEKSGFEKDPLTLSSIAQPFILSPQINFSDILSSLFSFFKEDSFLKKTFLKSLENKDYKTIGFFILETMRLEHPFPLLEREMTSDFSHKSHHYKKGAQVFILLDSFKNGPRFDLDSWKNNSFSDYNHFLFGAGERVCPGRTVALKCLSYMLIELVKQYSFDRIKPYKNHLYSGRDNDYKDTLKMSLYQLRKTLVIFWKSFLIGVSGER